MITNDTRCRMPVCCVALQGFGSKDKKEDFRMNNQTPRNNNQIISNNQIRITKPKQVVINSLVIGDWSLVIVCILYLGYWLFRLVSDFLPSKARLIWL